MRCINSRLAKFVLASALLLGAAGTDIAAAAETPAAAGHVVVIDDSVTGKALLWRFDYVGKWQHVTGKRDGRSNGTSTRSTHTGDVMVLGFIGTRVRLYGVVGPSGGRAGISIDGASTGGLPVEFYARRMRTHALIYQSPVMPNALHTISVAVWGTRDQHGHFYYVNIDGAEVDT